MIVQEMYFGQDKVIEAASGVLDWGDWAVNHADLFEKQLGFDSALLLPLPLHGINIYKRPEMV